MSQTNPVADQIARQFGVSLLAAGILVARGHDTMDKVAEFLGHTTPVFDPMSVFGVVDAIARIFWALDNGQRILVYGDYDVDGITSSALLYSYLRQYNPDRKVIDFFVPDRVKDGYGLTEKGVQRLADEGFNGLVVTVDNGISAYDAVELAKKNGLFQVIITDHHALPIDKPLPQTWLVNPQIYDQYPMMSGAGVAHMICSAMEMQRPTAKGVDWLADLAAIGTVADMMNLTGPNRPLVRYGLHLLNEKCRLGVEELLMANKFDFAKDRITTETIGFKIGPPMNAAGRIDNPTRCVELLVTEDPNEGKEIAEWLVDMNAKRREVSGSATDEALAQAAAQLAVNPEIKVLVLTSKDFHPGVVGLAASKVVEEYHRPAILLAEKDDGMLSGSARSIPGFSVKALLDNNRAHVPGLDGGGHAGAAGMHFHSQYLDIFRVEADKFFEAVMGGLVEVGVRFDATVSFGMLSHRLIDELRIFEPCGMGNETIMFRTVECEVFAEKPVGADKSHLKATFVENGRKIDAIGFGLASHLDRLKDQREGLTVYYKPDTNVFMGRSNLQLMLKDIGYGSALLPTPPAQMPHTTPADGSGLAPVLGGQGS